MGQMLVRQVGETEGCLLAGAIERAGSDALGKDAGMLAGVGEAGVTIGDDAAAMRFRRLHAASLIINLAQLLLLATATVWLLRL